MKQYLDLLNRILQNGEEHNDRTGTGTIRLFGEQIRMNLAEGFPLLTTKRMFWKGIVHELLWILSGNTNIRVLHEAGVHIWDEWADKFGDLGPVYGEQWRHWNHGGLSGFDQIKNLVKDLIETPDSRRHIVTAWNPDDVPDMTLPCCHVMFQMNVGKSRFGPGRPQRLDCHMYQRSADVFLGVPFNIASYALLTHIIGATCGYTAGDLIISYGDVHIYKNHIEQVEEQLIRKPKQLPHVIVDTGFPKTTPENILLSGYHPHPAIKAEVSV